MIYAATIKAEPGWKIRLQRTDKTLVDVELKEWGVVYHPTGISLIPIDHVNGESFFEKKNFVMLIDPNKTYKETDWLRAPSKFVAGISKA